jgi:hypothetical protein
VRASCRPMASAIRRMPGSRGSPLSEPLSWLGRVPAVPLPLPCRRSLARVHRMKQRGNAQRKSEIRAIDLRRRNACMRRGAFALSAWRPCRAGASRPRAGGAGRAYSTSLYRMAPVRPHGDKQVGSPGPRFVAKPHSTPPALRMMHSTRPARRNTSSWADMGTDVSLGVFADPSQLTQCWRLQGARWADKCLYHPRRHGYRYPPSSERKGHRFARLRACTSECYRRQSSRFCARSRSEAHELDSTDCGAQSSCPRSTQ